ncbi:Multicopper oxidase type 2 [Penicillium bovifimosum]|uniref:Multicopper oxidase type 2 n=1 Tax=Penicillium bovifimosum TaxID=126998 RepID=A0A9W9LBL3_9EURO|nr:Multicopper oxidase type 2 [Penicillium bovifimosum]KAJ5146427.1 Multicopper oxidase type 2 [Penicillium bovifimosum]
MMMLNSMPYNTTVHFHGIEQLNTPWSDGVPGLTQKPIQPGHSWTYRWTATGLNSGCIATAGLHEIIEVDPNAGWASLKLISAASLKSLMFLIDEHPMYIYEVDACLYTPLPTIYTGKRYAAMIKLGKPWKDYTIRDPDTQGDQIISGFATLRYQDSQDTTPSQPYVNYGGRNTPAVFTPLDDKGIMPPYLR